MRKGLPKGFVLDEGASDPTIFHSEGYLHWTVEDLLDLLSECKPSDRVWFMTDTNSGDQGIKVKPWELAFVEDGEVFLR